MRRFIWVFITTIIISGCAGHFAMANRLNGIRVGMTKGEVIAVLGGPDSVSVEEGSEDLVYVLNTSLYDTHMPEPYIVRLREGRVESYWRKADILRNNNAARDRVATKAPLQESSGTGFFVTNDGYVVTSNHVVDGFRDITVVEVDGTQARARLVKADPINDLALLKADNIKVRSLNVTSTSGQGRGQDVFTLGYPLIDLQGKEQKATFGRINALSGGQGDVRFIQIDIPVQPGNSGGPLINMAGNVIGIVSARLSERAVFSSSGVLPQNVNYAIKADYLLPLLDNLGRNNHKSKSQFATLNDVPDLVDEVEEGVVLIIAH